MIEVEGVRFDEAASGEDGRIEPEDVGKSVEEKGVKLSVEAGSELDEGRWKRELAIGKQTEGKKTRNGEKSASTIRSLSKLCHTHSPTTFPTLFPS